MQLHCVAMQSREKCPHNYVMRGKAWDKKDKENLNKNR